MFYRVAVFCLGVFLFCSSAFSKEIPSGSVEIGGDFNLAGIYQKSVTRDGDETVINNKAIGGLVSYYVLKNTAIGLNWVYYTLEFDYGDGDITEQSEQTIGPQITYNIDISEYANLKIFGGYLKRTASHSYTRISFGNITEGERKYNGNGWSAGVGAETYLLNNVTLSLKLERRMLSINSDDDSESEKVTENFATLGFSIYLR